MCYYPKGSDPKMWINPLTGMTYGDDPLFPKLNYLNVSSELRIFGDGVWPSWCCGWRLRTRSELETPTVIDYHTFSVLDRILELNVTSLNL